MFAQKLLLPKARRSGFSSQIKQRGIGTKQWNTKYERKKYEEGKRLRTHNCFWPCKKSEVVCSVGFFLTYMEVKAYCVTQI